MPFIQTLFAALLFRIVLIHLGFDTAVIDRGNAMANYSQAFIKASSNSASNDVFSVNNIDSRTAT
jgi:hypothetical protein